MVVSSPFLRCVQSAAELLNGIKFVYGREPSRADEAPELLQVDLCALHVSMQARSCGVVRRFLPADVRRANTQAGTRMHTFCSSGGPGTLRNADRASHEEVHPNLFNQRRAGGQ